jgi:hypothetical protein
MILMDRKRSNRGGGEDDCAFGCGRQTVLVAQYQSLQGPGMLWLTREVKIHPGSYAGAIREIWGNCHAVKGRGAMLLCERLEKVSLIEC